MLWHLMKLGVPTGSQRSRPDIRMTHMHAMLLMESHHTSHRALP